MIYFLYSTIQFIYKVLLAILYCNVFLLYSLQRMQLFFNLTLMVLQHLEVENQLKTQVHLLQSLKNHCCIKILNLVLMQMLSKQV